MDWTIAHLIHIEKRVLGINESADGRVGSSRNDSSGGGTVSHYDFETKDDDKKNSASLSSLGSTLIPVFIYSAVCLLVFLSLRRKLRRVYSPRTLPCLRTPFTPTPELPDGWFNWIKPFFAVTDDYILNNCSLDAFFFLRFLRILAIICLVGACIIWPILLPVNGTGKSGMLELDSLTIGNIAVATKFYAHVIAAWCFFGFVLYMVCRECIYYVNLRQAYLLSPSYSQRLSSRTVLFTCIPKPYMEESKLRKLFGDSAKNIWIVRDTSALRALVEDRESDADRLQQAEVTLIRTANAARQKYLRKNPPPTAVPHGAHPHLVGTAPSDGASQDDAEKGQTIDTTTHCSHESERHVEHEPEPPSQTEPQPVTPQSEPQTGSQTELVPQPSGLYSPALETPPDPEYTHPYGLHPTLPDVRGSVAALWIPVQSRPHHRPLRNFGRRVDTIRWTRARLKVLNREIWKLRRRHRGGDGAPLNAAFIEFDSQVNAQSAFQILAHHQPLHMSPRYIGIQPEDVIWGALRIRWWEHIMRRFFMMGVITAAIIFWSIPAVGVGIISNVESLSEMVFFLKWLMDLPKVILGVIQGLLPALALTWLMAAVPWMLRGCARVAGVPSHSLVELFVQHAYFAFQVVQVFLVTTLTSAASAAIIDVLKDPLSVKDVLSENLPKASNFYLSYILIQCLGAGSALLANFGDLFRHEVVSRVIPNPRRKFYRWSKLSVIHWGSEFPRFTNMGVIAISYSCIAPLILVFAGLGMFFVSYVYRYCLLYVYDSGSDTKGLFYPRALMQLMIGLYIAEVCLIGLFALKAAVGPLLLMVIFLVFTALVHLSLDEAVTPLLNNIPRTLALEKDIGRIAEDERPGDETSRPPDGGLAADYYNLTDDDDDSSTYPDTSPTHELDTDIQLRGIEGTGSIKYHVTEWTKSLFKSTLKKATLKPTPSTASQPESGLTRILTQIKIFITPDPSREPNFLLTFLHPEIYQDFRTLQPTVNPQPEHVDLRADYAKRAYWPPEMWAPAPRLWIPRDEARVSRQEVAHSSGVLAASDKGCWLEGGGGGGGEQGGKKGWGRRRKGRKAGRRAVRVECDFEESPLFEERVLY